MKLKRSILQLAKMAISGMVISLLVACGGNDYVESADRNDVITVGDSIFDLSGDLQRFLEEEAGQTFRNYTQSGAEIEGGLIATSITQQYSDAKSTDSNIDTIVMDGGGNDILIPAIILDPYGCRTHWWRWSISNNCRNLVDDTYVHTVNLINTMDDDGVENVIFLGYYELPRSNANLEDALTYGAQRLSDACNNSTANCTFVDPRGYIPAEHVKLDNIHPTEEGSRTLADLVWPHLQSVL